VPSPQLITPYLAPLRLRQKLRLEARYGPTFCWRVARARIPRHQILTGSEAFFRKGVHRNNPVRESQGICLGRHSLAAGGSHGAFLIEPFGDSPLIFGKVGCCPALPNGQKPLQQSRDPSPSLLAGPLPALPPQPPPAWQEFFQFAQSAALEGLPSDRQGPLRLSWTLPKLEGSRLAW